MEPTQVARVIAEWCLLVKCGLCLLALVVVVGGTRLNL